MANSTPYWRLAVHFHHIALGGESWVHNWEACDVTFANLVADDPGLAEAAAALVQYYQTLTLATTFIEKVVKGTWHPDTRADAYLEPGYDADESSTDFFSIYGTRPVTGTAESLDVVLDIRKSVSMGNPGRAPARSVILRSDVTTNSQGKRGLLPGSPVASGGAIWDAAKVYLEPHLLGGAHNIKLAMFGNRVEVDGETPNTVRLVTDLTPVSARIIQLTKQK